MKHDMHYRDCSASEIDDEKPSLFCRWLDAALFGVTLVLIMVVLVLAS